MLTDAQAKEDMKFLTEKGKVELLTIKHWVEEKDFKLKKLLQLSLRVEETNKAIKYCIKNYNKIKEKK